MVLETLRSGPSFQGWNDQASVTCPATSGFQSRYSLPPPCLFYPESSLPDRPIPCHRCPFAPLTGQWFQVWLSHLSSHLSEVSSLQAALGHQCSLSSAFYKLCPLRCQPQLCFNGCSALAFSWIVNFMSLKMSALTPRCVSSAKNVVDSH